MSDPKREPRKQSYQIQFARQARKDLENLPNEVFGRVMNEIDGLAINPRPHGVKKMQGRNGYRVRVGDYRILYDIAEAIKIVSIERVRHRCDVYRD